MEPANGSLFFSPQRGLYLDYISHDSVPYFKECAAAMEVEGFRLVELQVVPQNGMVKISAVIASGDPSKDIGVSDCAKAHHALQPKLLALLGKDEDDIMMEVCSPGTERNIRNAAEFATFTGRDIRVWDKNISDWVRGKIKVADTEKVTLETEGGDKTVLYSDIAKAKFIHF